MKLFITVKPGSRQNEIRLDEQGLFIVKIKAPPTEGEANEELISFLSKILKTPTSTITLLKGKTSRHKQLEIKMEESEVVAAMRSQVK